MGYIGNVFVAVDQLGNALAGGNPDNTISARIGYYANHDNDMVDGKSPAWYWRFFRWVVDNSFYPVDGPGHCHEAFHSDAGEVFDKNTQNWLVLIAMALFVIPSCLVIFLLLRLLWLFRIVKPRNMKILRPIFMAERLYTSRSKLSAMIHEIEENDMESSSELQKLVGEVVSEATDLRKKLA